MKTPNVQRVVDAVVQEFPTVRVGAWNCRKIAGKPLWSQHSYVQRTPLYQGNAADVFPTNPAQGDQIAAFIRRPEYAAVVKTVLWRVKDHFDHIHFDTWPEGVGTPPCAGGTLKVRHKDGRLGFTFTDDLGDVDLPLSDADIEKLKAELVPVIVDKVWYRLITNPVSGEQRGAQALLADAVKYSHDAANKE